MKFYVAYKGSGDISKAFRDYMESVNSKVTVGAVEWSAGNEGGYNYLNITSFSRGDASINPEHHQSGLISFLRKQGFGDVRVSTDLSALGSSQPVIS